MIQQLHDFYHSKNESVRDCLLTLRDIILAYSPAITETVKYGMPCFCYNGKMFCYLWTDKKTKSPYILIVEGKKIEHPVLIAGKRARMKILPVSEKKDIPIKDIHNIFDIAVTFYPT